MNIPTTDIISDIRTGKAKMEREGDTWTDEEKNDLLLQYFAGIDITTIAYDHQRTETAIIQQVMTTTSSGGLMLALKGPITCTPERWHRKPVTVNL